MAASSRENEIKLSVASIPAAKRLLSQNGFGVARRRVFERNLIFDTPSHELRKHDKLLRLREAGRHSLITFKGPGTPGKHKSREERETSIGSLPELQVILEGVGFSVTFIYEKYRTEYSQPDRRGVVTLDETPIGGFFELEGPPAWVDRTARRLGFRESDYITQSYGALYLEFCRRNGIRASHMIFSRRD